jgi:hypothetical protein
MQQSDLQNSVQSLKDENQMLMDSIFEKDEKLALLEDLMDESKERTELINEL